MELRKIIQVASFNFIPAKVYFVIFKFRLLITMDFLNFRPKASEVLYHPLFWSAELRLSFLRDTSDRIELEDRETDSPLLKALESTAPLALGTKWDEKMEPAFLNNIGCYRRYKYDSVRHLLRVMRNKLNHYRELPTEIQVLIKSMRPFDRVFASTSTFYGRALRGSHYGLACL